MQTEEETTASLLEAYQASLAELDSNCKIKINGLTMVAEENKDHAIPIAACIENQLKTVPKQYKLPVLYLIDSICKNCPKSMYVQLFTQNIVSNFCNVFEVSDEKVRRSLYKLRTTWSKTKIFPVKKLNAIDKRVHEMDSNWPVSTSTPTMTGPTNTINQQQQKPNINIKQQQHPSNTGLGSASNNSNNNLIGNSMQRQQQIHQRNMHKRDQQLHHQQQHQHQQNIPQILVNPHQQLQQQQQIFDIIPTQQQYLSNPTQQVNSQTPGQLLVAAQANPSTPMLYTPFSQPNPQNQPGTQILCPPFDPQIAQQAPAPPPLGPQLICNPYDSMPGQQQLMPPTQTLGQPLPPVAPQLPPPHQQSSHASVQQTILPTLPQQLTVVPQQQPQLIEQQSIQPTHLTILESLYGGKQCSNCSLRFDDNNKYAIHLDWHFRQKISKNDTMFARRKWYYPLNLWVQFREINDDDIQENNSDNNNASESLLPNNEDEIPTSLAFKDDEMNICSVCHEEFEKFFVDEEDEWRLKNAQLYEEDGRAYHPLCLKDMLQVNNLDTSA